VVRNRRRIQSDIDIGHIHNTTQIEQQSIALVSIDVQHDIYISYPLQYMCVYLCLCAVPIYGHIYMYHGMNDYVCIWADRSNI
jgi:hypothetical protein